MVINFPRRVVS